MRIETPIDKRKVNRYAWLMSGGTTFGVITPETLKLNLHAVLATRKSRVIILNPKTGLPEQVNSISAKPTERGLEIIAGNIKVVVPANGAYAIARKYAPYKIVWVTRVDYARQRVYDISEMNPILLVVYPDEDIGNIQNVWVPLSPEEHDCAGCMACGCYGCCLHCQ